MVSLSLKVALPLVVIVLAILATLFDSSMGLLSKVKTANEAINLVGKQAVVVGGTSGIGQGLALRLAQAGCSVTIVGRSAKRGAEIVQELEARSGRFRIVCGAKAV